jgi:hypothetical protein
MTQTIELDCAPGATRPGDLIETVIVGTGLPLREATSKLFGNWTWNYSDIDKSKWTAIKPVLADRIRKLHSAGQIRYGSW